MKKITNNILEHIFLFIILLAASFLFLFNLSNQYLWQDEAQTALISKTILTSGMPLGYDGKNYFSQNLGAEYGRNYLWRLHPWLPFYLLAGVFKLLGVNTFTARLPFGIFGILTVFLTYYFSKYLFKKKTPAMISTTLLLLAVPFLILSRECKYYSMASFFSLLGLYSYYNLLESRRFASVTFLFSVMLLFHTNHGFALILLSTVLFHALFCRRNALPKIALLSAGVIIINLPWAIWFIKMRYAEPDVVSFFNTGKFMKYSFIFISCILKYIFHPLLLAISVFIIWFNRRKGARSLIKDDIDWSALSLLAIFILLTILILSLCVHAPFFRFLGQTIPVLCMITGLVLFLAVRINILIGAATMILLIFITPLPEYIYEITHDYDGPIEGMVKFFDQYGKEDETVAITYGDMPLKFYTDMRVVGGLTGEDLSSAKDADWVILRKYTICEKDRRVREYLVQNIPWNKYRRIEIDYPDTPFENRESPPEHHYRTVKNEDRVVIYQRVR